MLPNIKFQIVPFENTPENAREILGNFGTNIDVIGGIFDDTMLAVRRCAGLELVRGPFYCAVSIHHRLAAKDKLQISDLYGENLLLMYRGWSLYVDQLRDDLWQNHPQINIVDFDFYGVDIFNHCENTNDVLLAIPGWANVHPLLKVIPVEWNHCIPYGILHSPTPSPIVQQFLDAAELMDARLAIREKKDRSAVDRVKAAYAEKYDPLMMHDSKRDVANLLHEEAEARFIRERLRQKQEQQAQQRQNKKKSRDSWER